MCIIIYVHLFIEIISIIYHIFAAVLVIYATLVTVNRISCIYMVV